MNIFDWLIQPEEKRYRKLTNLVQNWTDGMETYTPDNFYKLVNAYASWVYICANKNAKAVSIRNLRLYVAKGKGQKSLQPTRALEGQQKLFIFDRHESQISKAYDRYGSIEVEQVLVHPFLDLMRNINPFFNKTDFLYLTDIFLELTGNAYWHITRNALGLPAELWILPSQGVTIIPDQKKFIEGYNYDNGTEKVFYPESNIIHHKFPAPGDIFYGKSPLSAVMQAVNIGNSANTYQNALFKNMGVIPGYFHTDANLGDNEFKRLNEQLDKYRGAERAGATPLLDNGLKYENTAIKPSELFNVVINKVSLQEIAAAFDVPMGKLTSESVNKANSDNADREHAKDGVSPRLKFIEEKINEKLLPLYDEKLFCAFDNPVKEDNEEVRQRDETDLKWGVKTHNEIRKTQGLSPVEDGDRRYLPANYIPVDLIENFYKNKTAKESNNNQQGGENTER